MSTLTRFKFSSKTRAAEKPQLYTEAKDQTGFSIAYTPKDGGGVLVEARADGAPDIQVSFSRLAIDEAHILYIEATELLHSRAAIKEEGALIRKGVEQLFAAFRGERMPSTSPAMPPAPRISGEFVANPGKQLAIEVDGVTYMRLPVKTRLITMYDTDIVPLVEEYVLPHLKPDDLVFVSEKALTITQGRVVDMGDIHPSRFARFLARNVGNNYGSGNFHGFGHGTTLAMQLFIEEAGYPRVFFAALASALTRPFGIRGLFYLLCGKRAKSIDCPMSFLILEYAHAAKLAPNNPSGEARRMRAKLKGHDVIILDANYRGAFSLGKSSRAVSEKFIQKLFRDNPLGQSDEMTPFCIVRRKEVAAQ